MSEPNTEWDNVPASRVLPAWREQVRKLSLEINELWDKNQTLKSEVERLTKAGDAMANTLRDGGVIVSGHSLADEWLKAKLHAAKDGEDAQ